MINKWHKLTLSQQFKLACLVVFLVGSLIIGIWVGQQIEMGVTNRTAAITALYVDSFVSPVLQPLTNSSTLSASAIAELTRLLEETPLGQQIVSFKVWLPDGTVVYATDGNLMGHSFPVGNSLSQALTGQVTAELTALDEAEQASERQFGQQLIEIYAPVRAQGSGQIIAVSEFYQWPDALITEIRTAQLTSGMVVGLSTLFMYLVLSGLASRALRDYERKTGSQVEANVDEIPAGLPLPVKMTLYRILQEALSNGYRHAGGLGQRVTVQVEGVELRVEVSDKGPGFDPQAIFREGHLGLATMHERAEVLGGCFNIESAPGKGTTIWSYLPLQIPEIPLPLMLTEMAHE